MPPKPPPRSVLQAAARTKAALAPRPPRAPAASPAKAPSPAGPRSHDGPPPARLPWWREYVRAPSMRSVAVNGFRGFLGVCAVIWTRDHIARTDRVAGSSMAPTLNATTHETGRRDRIVIRQYHERGRTGADGYFVPSGRGLCRGDVVTFWKPHRPEEMSIKRVVALEGDTVYPRRGYALDQDVLRQRKIAGLPDGLPDVDEDAIQSDDQVGRVVVPPGHVWVEGDNFRKSRDSNDFGPLSKSLIEGRAVLLWGAWLSVKRVGDARSAKERRMASRVIERRGVAPPLSPA